MCICCQVFGIPYSRVDRENIREKAGNITPAIVMTSAIAAAFVALNLLSVSGILVHQVSSGCRCEMSS